MAIDATYSHVRENFATLLERVTDDQEIVVIHRRGREDVALVSAKELSSLLETAHLLRSPRNAQRLLTALRRAQAMTAKPQSVEKLRQDLGFNAKG